MSSFLHPMASQASFYSEHLLRYSQELFHKFIYSLSETKDSLHRLFNRTLYFADTFVHIEQRREYNLIKKLRNFSRCPESAFSLENEKIFSETARKVNELFTDDAIMKHCFRMCSCGLTFGAYAKSDNIFSSWHFYQNRQGEEKTLVRLHELVEMLFLKWDCGINIDTPASYHFWYAHQKAIKIENLFRITIARKLNIPLTLKALEYIRLCDEAQTMLEHCTHICEHREEFLDSKIADAVKTLTKNQDILPSLAEMEAYVQFMSESETLVSMSKKTIATMVWNRYFFTILHPKFGPDFTKLILLLLFYNKTEGNFEKHPASLLLPALEKVLEQTLPQDLRAIASEFTYDMESIRRKERIGYFLQKFIDLLEKAVQPPLLF